LNRIDLVQFGAMIPLSRQQSNHAEKILESGFQYSLRRAMTKKTKAQLSFDEGVFSPQAPKVPDSREPPGKQAKPSARSTAKPSTPVASQPYLPGLSRRGRPRSRNPVPATLRAAESRKRRIEAGIKRIELLLAPEIAADLDLLVDHFGDSRVEIINRLVAKAAKRLRRLREVSATPSDRRSTS
jgi:hypothetical protein